MKGFNRNVTRGLIYILTSLLSCLVLAAASYLFQYTQILDWIIFPIFPTGKDYTIFQTTSILVLIGIFLFGLLLVISGHMAQGRRAGIGNRTRFFRQPARGPGAITPGRGDD